jgi:hypothetical protein
MRGRGGIRPGAGRKGNWQQGETQTIRVPAAIKEDLLTLGQQLDRGHGVIAGQSVQQLESVLAHYQAQCDANSGEEWQVVRQLISEVRTILEQNTHRGFGRMRHQGGSGQQHQNRCGFGRPAGGRWQNSNLVLGENSEAIAPEVCPD